MTRIEAIADCIRAAGFDGMADQYQNEPSMRQRVLADCWLWRTIVRRLGEKKAAEFYALAMMAEEQAA
jgi:hypothetical protein